MKNLYVYEIISAKSASEDELVEFALLTEDGLDGDIIRAEVFPEEIIIRTTKDDVTLKKVSPEITKRVKDGSPFLLINMAEDSVTKIRTV